MNVTFQRPARDLGWTVRELTADYDLQRSKPAELLELPLAATSP